jgi:hypothetical protein
MQRFAIMLGTILLLGGTAQAQLSQYNMPIESGTLESHIDLQFQYSKYSFGTFDEDVGLFSLEGQLAFGRFEVALNVPFMTHGWDTSPNTWAFGDIMAGFKVRLLNLANKFGVSVFSNLWLPTHSGDAPRSNVKLHLGAVASLQLIGFSLGAGLQTYWTFLGDDLPDTGLIGIYGYARVPILGLIALQAALEYFNSVHPNGELVNAFLITPSVEVSVAWFHAGIGARIAVTDEAQAVTLGRVGLLANAGVRFH